MKTSTLALSLAAATALQLASPLSISSPSPLAGLYAAAPADASMEFSGSGVSALEEDAGVAAMQLDVGAFVECLAGPGITPEYGCETFDFDGDADVDLRDFAISQAGLPSPPDPVPVPYVWELQEALPAPLMDEDPDAPVVDVAAAAAATPPGPGDLLPTIDVQITQEIIDKAAELGNDPAAMYEFVRNECQFQAYFGSQKGSVETLRQRAGNDYDLASLLIALLRASNYPARYAVGMVEMPVDRATSWLAVEDGTVAGSILYTMGMEGTSVVSGSTVVAVRCRRVWVEAWVPRGYGSPTWVPLDPAFALTDVHEGLDIPAEMGLSAQTFVDEYFDPSDPGVILPRPETVLELFQQEITGYLATNYPGLTLADVRRTWEIQPEQLGALPAALPYTVRSRDTSYAEIPANRRYQIRFHLHNGATNLINYTADLPTIARQRVTISYVGATPADQAIIDAHNGLLYTPPNLINIKPVLKIGGQTVATGAVGIGAGRTHSSDMYFLAPANAQGFPQNVVPQIYNTIIAGEYQAIGLAIHGATSPLLAPEDPADTEDFLGKLRHATAMGYLSRCITADDDFGALLHARVVGDVDDAIVQDQIRVTTDWLGNPNAWEWRGLTVDADRKIVGVWKVDEYESGCGGDGRELMLLGGAEGSLYENRIYEDDFDHEAVSTIKILQLAADQGITIYHRWSSTTLPANSLPSSVRSAIISAIAGGNVVTFPASQITYYNWTGVGYIDEDLCTGAAGYIISGGQFGGSTVDSWTDMVPIDPSKQLAYIAGDVEVPANNSPAAGAVFDMRSAIPLLFQYLLWAVYTDGSADVPSTFTHNSHAPRALSPGHYWLTVGDQGADHVRKLSVVCMAEASGPQWVARFPHSQSTSDLVAPFRGNVESFLNALTAAGAHYSIAQTLRPPERAYLMYWAWQVAHGANPTQVPPKQGVDICWQHYDANYDVDTAASQTAAQQMVTAYNIVHPPALNSRHILGLAIDMNISWSGNLSIVNASGSTVVISSLPRTGQNTDLHAVGATYGVVKNTGDPPHWSDTGG